MSSKRKYIVSFSILLGIATLYYSLLYPTQLAEYEGRVIITTPREQYMNDCLHPCIRKDYYGDGYWLSQSPYYQWNSQTENPILYHSDNYREWDNGILVTDTPPRGYNSDPTIYVLKDTVFVFWRECNTPLCDSLSVSNVTVGVFSTDGLNFSRKNVFLTNCSNDGDIEQAPTLIRWKDRYRFYATWYQYEPTRKNKGIAIWEGTSLTNPDFKLINTIGFKSTNTVDKLIQKVILGKIIYIPKPLKFDLWHFDIVENDGKLLMVSSSEKGDNIMLSYSKDGSHFKTRQKPLINNHYMENFTGYRQYYYKPTAIIENDSLKVFYTAYDRNQSLNILLLSSIPIDKI